MIIDSHYHTIGALGDAQAAAAWAERGYEVYGPGSRSGMQRIGLSFEDFKRRFLDFIDDPDGEKLLERMSRGGVDVTVICVTDNSQRYTTVDDLLSVNRDLAEFANRSKGRILALAGVDPRRKEAPEIYRRCIEEYGMRGLKFHPYRGYYPNSEEAYAVLKVAERLGTPVLVHTGIMPAPHAPAPSTYKYARVGLLDEVAQNFPGLKIIAGHCGRFDFREWASVAEARPNLYGDLSNWQLFAAANYERFCHYLREMLDIAGTDSLLFASDGHIFEALVPNAQWIRILRDLPRKAPPGLKFTEEEIAAILGGNAQRIFGL
ncbi:MAG: amidohydrolase family protein [Dehalococcoidia bacterium]|nr:amidohydrolase family protein [Dehalococcoidia bacterium]